MRALSHIDKAASCWSRCCNTGPCLVKVDCWPLWTAGPLPAAPVNFELHHRLPATPDLAIIHPRFSQVIALFKSLGHELDAAKARELMDEVDTDRNGTVEFSEFLMVCGCVSMIRYRRRVGISCCCVYRRQHAALSWYMTALLLLRCTYGCAWGARSRAVIAIITVLGGGRLPSRFGACTSAAWLLLPSTDVQERWHEQRTEECCDC